MATAEQLQTWLAEAEQARHEIAMGASVTTITSSSGKSVTYGDTDLGKLDAYIADLKRQLGLGGSRPFTFNIG